jgi:hypothetical protein
LGEGRTLYRGPFDGGYIPFYVVLNLVLTLFCLVNEVEYLAAFLKACGEGKAKNNPIPIMLIGQGRCGKSSLNETPCPCPWHYNDKRTT